MNDFEKVVWSKVIDYASNCHGYPAKDSKHWYAYRDSRGVEFAQEIFRLSQLAIDKAVRAATVRQVENWRDFIDGQPELKWLVKDMNEAIEAFSDPTRTDPNGVWLEAIAALSPNNGDK